MGGVKNGVKHIRTWTTEKMAANIHVTIKGKGQNTILQD
jgi:hypothetical protein